jgi:hypothetical protein
MNIEEFKKIEKKEIAYFLGYMWSDGYIKHYISNKIKHHKISLEINNEDGEYIKDILYSITNWSLHKRKRKETWKESYTFSKNNKELYLLLESMDYVNKSYCEPTKILELLNDNLRVYFWKGVIDGDGSIGLCSRGSYFQISSTYNYQYIELQKELTKLDIKRYNIYRQISKKLHKSSVLKIYGKEILKLEKFFIDFGLQRKTNKFTLIKKKYERN